MRRPLATVEGAGMWQLGRPLTGPATGVVAPHDNDVDLGDGVASSALTLGDWSSEGGGGASLGGSGGGNDDEELRGGYGGASSKAGRHQMELGGLHCLHLYLCEFRCLHLCGDLVRRLYCFREVADLQS